jgi:hypothetical protein
MTQKGVLASGCNEAKMKYESQLLKLAEICCILVHQRFTKPDAIFHFGSQDTNSAPNSS